MPIPSVPAVEIVPGLRAGGDAPALFIAGPCVIESRDHCLGIARTLARIAAAKSLPLVFKASFDKANRTSLASFRGPGLDEGLRILEEVGRETGLPVTTDVHVPAQAGPASKAVQLLQVPAFLCRQTDLLVACAATGRPVNVKKGQFVAPWDMEHAVGKLQAAGAKGVLLTERGTSFGYGSLVVDMRSFQAMRALGCPTIHDATHSVQEPGGRGASSGGRREFVATLARAAAAAGADGFFFEVHPDPPAALSDPASQIAPAEFEAIVPLLQDLHALVRR